MGLPNGELRLADDVGVVGKVLHSGQVMQVDDVRADCDVDRHRDAGAVTGGEH